MDLDIRNDRVVNVGDNVWVDRYGHPHHIESMTDSHLYYTLRMIWNHSAPEEFKFRPYIKYCFYKEYYSPKRLKKLIPIMINEALSRASMKPEWKKDIEYMVAVAQKDNVKDMKVLQG